MDRDRTRRIVGWALVVLAAIVVSAAALAMRPESPPPPPPFPSVPAQACQLPASADKAGATRSFSWRQATETDRSEGSVILFVSDRDTLLCIVARSTDGRLGGTWTAIGTEAGDGNRLTLDSGTVPSAADPSAQSGQTILIGRVPAGTAAVRVAVGSDVESVSAIGSGHYLAWLRTSGLPTRIDALDAAGKVLATLANPNGIPFGG